ncbi:GNAT family N-acetyltransferase [Fundidesulfovibrio terrae]|uniref:GNAT family N-acetyltransferase n=1 Tax=Fundidesulfovibrio terrae TaxID=2922866 RepID=UPI001FAED7EF|nr:GNAT family N-acetyltransferase [Fundidesulfovibrio terrae]
MPVNNTEPLSVYRAGPGYAKCLADMILLASRAHRKRGFLDHITGLPEPEIIRLLSILAMHPDQPWGRIDNTYVALVDGVCSGTVTVRPELATRDYPFAPPALRDAAARMGLAGAQVRDILGRQEAYVDSLSVFDEPTQPGAWLVEYLGVRRENQATGVARGLMARAADDGRKAGGATLELYCDTGNTRAEQLFAMLGYELVRKYRYDPVVEVCGEAVKRFRLTLR